MLSYQHFTQPNWGGGRSWRGRVAPTLCWAAPKLTEKYGLRLWLSYRFHFDAKRCVLCECDPAPHHPRGVLTIWAGSSCQVELWFTSCIIYGATADASSNGWEWEKRIRTLAVLRVAWLFASWFSTQQVKDYFLWTIFREKSCSGGNRGVWDLTTEGAKH